jgi:hypothetical protein
LAMGQFGLMNSTCARMGQPAQERSSAKGIFMDAARRIDVISDAICPWCWIGKRQLEAALALMDQAFTIHWRPFQLNPDMPPEGVERAAYRAAKGL